MNMVRVDFGGFVVVVDDNVDGVAVVVAWFG